MSSSSKQSPSPGDEGYKTSTFVIRRSSPVGGLGMFANKNIP